MIRRLLIYLPAIALAVSSQTTLRLPVWDGQRYQYPAITASIGPDGRLVLPVANGTPGPPGPPGPPGQPGPQGPPGLTATLHSDVLLKFDPAQGGWVLPAPPSGQAIQSVSVWVNGLRYHLGGDFTIQGSVIKALPGASMEPGFQVIVDYWTQ